MVWVSKHVPRRRAIYTLLFMCVRTNYTNVRSIVEQAMAGCHVVVSRNIAKTSGGAGRRTAYSVHAPADRTAGGHRWQYVLRTLSGMQWLVPMRPCPRKAAWAGVGRQKAEMRR